MYPFSSGSLFGVGAPSLSKRPNYKDGFRFHKILLAPFTLSVLGSILLQWSHLATSHARCLCKASSWRAGWTNPERDRQICRKTERRQEIRSRPGLCSVCWMSIFQASLSPLCLSRVCSGTDSMSEYVCTCAPSPCQNLCSEAGTVKVRRCCLCNSCCGTHLPGCI